MTAGQSGENVSLHTWKAYNIYFGNMTANENLLGLIFICRLQVLTFKAYLLRDAPTV